MSVVRRYAVLAAVCAAAGSATAGAALLDHVHPGPTGAAEWHALWWCEHRAARCDEPKPWADGWHRRERVYTYGLASTLTLSGLFGIAAWSRRRAPLRQ